MPIVHPADSSWANLGQRCSATAPIRLAPDRPARLDGRFRTRDERDVLLARRLPGGYGGLYLEHDPPPPPGERARPETQRLVVLLVDTTQREAALRALDSAVRTERPHLHVLRAHVKPARWSFAELYDWYGVLLARAGRDGVTMTDIDEKENRIVFGVEDTEARRRVEARLAPLKLPCFLLGIEVVGREPRG